VPAAVAHHADHRRDQQQEGGAAGAARDEGHVGGGEGPLGAPAAAAAVHRGVPWERHRGRRR
jgi:hypothetical protein